MSDARRRIGERVFVVVVWAAIVLNVLKSLPHVVFDIGFPYWLLTYDEGFIRRGLVGTLVHELIVGYDPGAQRSIVLVIYVSVAITFLALLYVLARRASARVESPRTRVLVLAGVAALGLSQLTSTTVSNCGYLDVFIFLLAVVCAYCADRGRFLAAGIVAAIGPLVHDAFIFVWLPIALVEARRIWRLAPEERRAALKKAAALASPIVTTLLVMTLHSRSAEMHLIDKMPVGAEIKDSFRLYQFGLSTSDALRIMMDKYKDMPGQFLLASAFFLPPIAVTAWCGYAIDTGDRRFRRALFAFAVTFAPCTALLLAWDLSRILVWSGVGAFILLLANVSAAPSDERRTERAPLIALAALVLFSTGPHVYSYFEVAYADYPSAPSLLRHTPAALVTYAYVRLYNRKLYVREWASDADGKCNVDAAWVEKIDPCSFKLRSGQDVYTHELWLSPGTYEATVATAPASGCTSSAAATAVITPTVAWRFTEARPPTRIGVNASSSTTVSFAISSEESAMARTKIRVSAAEGCFRVDRIAVLKSSGP